MSVRRLHGVREAREEAGEAEEDEKDDCHGASGGVTRTVLGEDRYEKLERQEGACGEMFGKVCGGCKGLGDCTL